jgi:hypothetical protein
MMTRKRLEPPDHCRGRRLSGEPRPPFESIGETPLVVARAAPELFGGRPNPGIGAKVPYALMFASEHITPSVSPRRLVSPELAIGL